MKVKEPVIPAPSESEATTVQSVIQASMEKTKGTKARYFCFLTVISLITALLVCLIFPPRFVLWRGLHIPEASFTPEVNRAVDTLNQLDAPLSSTMAPSNRVIRWRLLFPILWYNLHLPKTLFLIMPCLGCLLSLGMIAHVAYGTTQNRLLTIAITIILATSSWFFVSIGWLTYFDSWLVLGLLIVGFAQSRSVLLVAFLLCPWIDERFIIALPLCLMIRFLYFGQVGARDFKSIIHESLLAVSTIIFYAVFRLSLSMSCTEDHSTWYLSNQLTLSNISSVSIPHYLEGIWYGIRSGIIFVGIFIWLAYAGNSWRWRILLWMILLSTLVIGLVIAGDLSRSMAMFVPAALSGIVLMAKERPRLLTIAITLALLVTLLSSAKHVVSSFKTSTPINSLSKEIAMYRHPPDFLSSDYYLAKAVQSANQGKFDKALHLLDNALVLDICLSPAYYCRASVLSIQGDLSRAIADLNKAISLEPNFEDALYLRGVLYQERNETAAAMSDFKHALQISTPDWPKRTECRERIARLSGN